MEFASEENEFKLPWAFPRFTDADESLRDASLSCWRRLFKSALALEEVDDIWLRVLAMSPLAWLMSLRALETWASMFWRSLRICASSLLAEFTWFKESWRPFSIWMRDSKVEPDSVDFKFLTTAR